MDYEQTRKMFDKMYEIGNGQTQEMFQQLHSAQISERIEVLIGFCDVHSLLLNKHFQALDLAEQKYLQTTDVITKGIDALEARNQMYLMRQEIKRGMMNLTNIAKQ